MFPANMKGMIGMEKTKMVLSVDKDIFFTRLKEAVAKAISEMPTDYIKVEAKKPFSNIPDGMRCYEISCKVHNLFVEENLRQDQALVILDQLKLELTKMKVN